METEDRMHASIRLSLPRQRCGEVREVIGVLTVLEDVYNHLYAWHALAGENGTERKAHGPGARRTMPEIGDPGDLVPADGRLCLARIEIEPPAFIEVVGAPGPVETIYSYLKARDGERDHRSVRAIEKIEAIRAEIEHLWESNFPEGDIQQAVSMHLVSPLKRLERLDGLELYDREEPAKAPPRRSRSERPLQPSAPSRGH